MITRRHYAVTNLDETLRIDFDRHNYVVSTMDLGNIPASFSTFTGTQQNGRTITSRHLSVRDVNIEGHIIADSFEDMKRKKADLQRIILPTRDFWLVVDDAYRIRLTASTTLQYSKHWYEHNDILTTFTIEAIANNPFFETIQEKVANIGEWIPTFHFLYWNPVGEKFTFGRRMQSKSVTVNNECEVPVGIIINLSATGGTVVDPVISNPATGEYFRVYTTMSSGDLIRINTNYGEKSVENVTTGENLMPSLDFASTWLQMEPGASTFRYDYDESSTGSIKCEVTYVPQLVEV